jgi:hypothetical protein
MVSGTKIINKIPTMADQELLNLFKNATCLLVEDKNVEAAESVITAVEQEWKNRLSLARAGHHSYATPHVGMLATLGYHVGSVQGEKSSVRKKILAQILIRHLPMVSSPAYTDEWGEPKSSKRYWRLIHFFQSQLNNPGNIDNAQAMIEWSEDLEWVQKYYSHLGIMKPPLANLESQPARDSLFR